jgi:uncharacterized protein
MLPTARRPREPIESIDLVALTRRLLDDAGMLRPPLLRSIDAIHLVAAHRAAGTLRSVVTYDHRMPRLQPIWY